MYVDGTKWNVQLTSIFIPFPLPSAVVKVAKVAVNVAVSREGLISLSHFLNQQRNLCYEVGVKSHDSRLVSSLLVQFRPGHRVGNCFARLQLRPSGTIL